MTNKKKDNVEEFMNYPVRFNKKLYDAMRKAAADMGAELGYPVSLANWIRLVCNDAVEKGEK